MSPRSLIPSWPYRLKYSFTLVVLNIKDIMGYRLVQIDGDQIPLAMYYCRPLVKNQGVKL